MSFYTVEELRGLGFKKLGHDVSVSKKASLYGVERIEIGSCSRIDDFCVLSAGAGGILIGRNVHIATMATLIGEGRIEVHDFAGLSGRVSVYSSSDDFSGAFMTGPTAPKEFTNVDSGNVTIGKHVIVGAGSLILPGVNIGEGSAIGALSTVRKSLPPFGVYAGTPLRRLKDRKQELLELERKYLEQFTPEQ